MTQRKLGEIDEKWPFLFISTFEKLNKIPMRIHICTHIGAHQLVYVVFSSFCYCFISIMKHNWYSQNEKLDEGKAITAGLADGFGCIDSCI